MTARRKTGWQDIRLEVKRRLNAREWKPGEMIPTEADLAREFGCARSTVNRALRSLAETGVLDRRRKAGTRVALRPVRRATLSIPVIRQEIEDRNQDYGYSMLSRDNANAPPVICARMGLKPGTPLLHVTAVHLADGAALVFEDRWINPAAVPQVNAAPFQTISANEWLLMHAPYSHGDIAFSASPAGKAEAGVLGLADGAALFVIDRTTWNGEVAVTTVQQSFVPGYRLRTEL